MKKLIKGVNGMKIYRNYLNPGKKQIVLEYLLSTCSVVTTKIFSVIYFIKERDLIMKFNTKESQQPAQLGIPRDKSLKYMKGENLLGKNESVPFSPSQ